MSGLLESWDWFDNALQNILREQGFPRFNKSQSMMIMYVSAGVNRPIEIARKMRLSRQAIRHIEKQLLEAGVIEARPDPDDKRSKILAISKRTRSLHAQARKTILQLEDLLAERIGIANVAALRAIMNLDWGPVVQSADELTDVATAREDRRTNRR